jgi:hypothetical protein
MTGIIQSSHLRTPNPGSNPGFTPHLLYNKCGGELRVKPRVWRPEMWTQSENLRLSVAEFFIIGERFVVITMLYCRQLQAAEVLSKLSIMNGRSSFVKVPLVITKQLVMTKQLKLYFNSSSRIPI